MLKLQYSTVQRYNSETGSAVQKWTGKTGRCQFVVNGPSSLAGRKTPPELTRIEKGEKISWPSAVDRRPTTSRPLTLGCTVHHVFSTNGKKQQTRRKKNKEEENFEFSTVLRSALALFSFGTWSATPKTDRAVDATASNLADMSLYRDLCRCFCFCSCCKWIS